MAMPVSQRVTRLAGSGEFFSPLKLNTRPIRSNAKSSNRVEIITASSSMKEKAMTGLTAVALTAALVIPEMAEAAQPGISPSLKNFLLSIVAGGVVLTVIVGAVVAVANFDPVKRS
ncbi:Photosystem II PsbX protein [Dioscorea alata]|uniref:Photosystem II PsbX protein n=1 Tax=Dioscorea alata TaxID=55571 RepID=A0ACB7U8G1_DIOAL|nr:Photosystem II PsbX protein [Dioscorea alata]